jgi:hypothetical protein
MLCVTCTLNIAVRVEFMARHGQAGNKTCADFETLRIIHIYQ